MKIIDGLDIGWGGVQRWATSRMPEIAGLHLDFACGYGTFTAQLGWRFPDIHLVGLNIDYSGPHACIKSLLDEAGVVATLVQSDAQYMPFKDETFRSVSCFLGLQDIKIGFGETGVAKSVREAVRVLRYRGVMVLIDEFPFSDFQKILDELPVIEVERAERRIDVRWERGIAERAIALYAEGWVAQHRGHCDRRLYDEKFTEMKYDMEDQLREQGYYVPFGPIRMIIVEKREQTAAVLRQ
ncbi:MAG: class I SAM-dependent methyltransferase [candidate division WOR-3 bacterium]|nr:MAG: class I SAM-dependent methyltransferase [candidate division WOR-3 bacterium]